MSDPRNDPSNSDDFADRLAAVPEDEPRAEFEASLRRQFVTGFEEPAVEVRAPVRSRRRPGQPSKPSLSRGPLWAAASLAAAVLLAAGWFIGQLGDDGLGAPQGGEVVDQQLETQTERPGDPADVEPVQDARHAELAAGDPPQPEAARDPSAPPLGESVDESLESTPAASPGWRLVAAAGEPSLSGPERRPLERGLRDGTTLNVEDIAVDVQLDAGWSVRALPGTRFAAEALTASREEGPSRLRLLSGELLIKTPRDYAGPRIEIATPHTDVTVVGTALSVMSERSGTCVCVSHGTVAVAPHDERADESVTDRQTCYVFADGVDPYLGGFFQADGGIMGPKEGMHLAPLLDFDAE